jgi:hypothetical protein
MKKEDDLLQTAIVLWLLIVLASAGLSLIIGAAGR